MGMAELGTTLKEARTMLGWSLREAEDKTDVSNGYLYLLEQGRVQEPSPHMLHKLSAAYNIDYTRLMELAGYLGTQQEKTAVSDRAGVALSSTLKELTQKERDEVKKYIQFIRSQRPKVAH